MAILGKCNRVLAIQARSPILVARFGERANDPIRSAFQGDIFVAAHPDAYAAGVLLGAPVRSPASAIRRKAGCTAETLRKWVRQAERDQGRRPGLTTEERQRLKQLERENFELRRANEILRKAAAFFAQAELDRRAK
jgi:transposase